MSASRFGIALLFAALGASRASIAQVPGELRGRVTNARTAQALENAQIEVDGAASVRSTAVGEYALRGLEPGIHTVRIRALGFAERREDVSIVNGRSTVLNMALEPSVTSLAAVKVVGIVDASTRGAIQFDRAAIVQSHKRDVGELLQSVPGVVVTQSGGPGAPSRVSIRGSASNEVLVLVDGAPVNSAIDGEVDLSRLSLETAERVVVLTGAQSARYGPRALAGVIDIQTRRPTGEVSVLGRAGAWGERDAAMTVGERRSLGALQSAASFTGNYRTTQGDFSYDVPDLRGGGTARRENADLRSRDVLGGASLEGKRWDARIRGGWSDVTRGMAGSIVQPSRTGRQSQTRISGGFDSRGRRGPIAWTALGDVSRERATFVDPAPPFGAAFDDTVRATGASGSLSSSIGSDASNVSLGVDLQSLDVASTLLEVGAPHWQRTLGVWGRTRFAREAVPGLLLDADLSGRVDQTSLIDGTNFSPRLALGATMALVSLSASIGAGYAPPSLSDQFFHEGVQVRPNPALQPERTRRDLEARLALREQNVRGVQVSADAAAYRADVDGMILWMPDFRFVWSPANFDVARSGWTVGSRVAWPLARLDARTSFAWSNVTYRGGVLSGPVVYRPRTSGSVTAGFSPGPVRLEATTRYVGERRTVPGSSLNVLDSYWRTDLAVSHATYVRRWKVDASVGVDNLLDQSAAMLVDYPFPSRAWTISLRLQRDERPR